MKSKLAKQRAALVFHGFVTCLVVTAAVAIFFTVWDAIASGQSASAVLLASGGSVCMLAMLLYVLRP